MSRDDPTNRLPTLGFLLHDAARLLRRRFEQRARHFGLTRAQWQAMAYLAPREGIHQGALAEILDVEPITLMRVLDKLEEHGLIERRQHPTDRRTRLLYLTPAAHPLLAEMRRLGELTRAEALAGLSDTDRDSLFRMLSALKTNLAEACGRPVVGPDETEREVAENG